MKLNASDPDIQTLVGRINDGDIDLQPDFQRGNVWNLKKKQLLIDTILRDWHIPPVHIVSHGENCMDEVLDGQQRLATICDFYSDNFPIDGLINPSDDLIYEAHGKYFSQLIPPLSKRIKQFSIRVITITDFQPEEPGELFFRLNHQVTLTPAEARNAYFGEVRDQVKAVARNFAQWGLEQRTIGFSNARMAHDDVVARVMTVLDWGNISEKLTAGKLAERYRSGNRFPEKVTEATSVAFKTLGASLNSSKSPIKLNKATLWSWVMFLAIQFRLEQVTPCERVLGEYMNWFESMRISMKGRGAESGQETQACLAIFNDRASSRVADVSSVVIRDLVLWGLLEHSPLLNSKLTASPKIKQRIETAVEHLNWFTTQRVTNEVADIDIESEMVERALKGGWGDIR
ncbi:DUF262 domain-containing protein [Pelagicoccus sp. SDUM812005]|uniref:DUF262 domain-containing protein n=1 Tax=Pelagicoccus sp. SDUM812005 TaxID=3041257 RepID=UPI0028105280|nr:DUF262 domain-containing protein [Pelagicoccus sp. SDUM812005]MDQ8183797.1 DUF262 domain-containing protein [Pelagicoccus sp. SDUM812005]